MTDFSPKPPPPAETDIPAYKGPERRRSQAVFDEHGHVHTPSYSGPDRRAHRLKQDKLAHIERKKFLSRSVMMGSIFSVVIAYATIFLLAPEILATRPMPAPPPRGAAPVYPHGAADPSPSLGGRINHAIETAEQATAQLREHFNRAHNTTSLDLRGLAVLPGAHDVLAAVRTMDMLGLSQKTAGAAASAIDDIKAALYAGNGNAGQMLDSLRRTNPDVGAILGKLPAKDLQAAALLLTLNEFRGNVSNGRPFETDLAVLEKYAGDDPQLRAALKRLAPYAAAGVLSRDRLEKELMVAARDIALSAARGEDAPVQREITEHLNKMLTAPTAAAITGTTPADLVARAQKQLQAGDTAGAMKTLQTLQTMPGVNAGTLPQQAAATADADAVSAEFAQAIATALGQQIGQSLTGGISRGGSVYISPALQGGP